MIKVHIVTSKTDQLWLGEELLVPRTKPSSHTRALHGNVIAMQSSGNSERPLRTKLQSEPTDRLWWNLTKNISGLSKTRDRSAPDVDSLASYFADKLSLSPNFDPSLSIVPPVIDVIYRKTWRVKFSMVCSMLRSIDVNKAVDPDDISPYILKYCCKELCHPVCLLFHQVC